MHVRNSNNKLKRLIIITLILVGLASCGRGSNKEIEILRFEQVLFETPAEQLPAELQKFDEQYRSPLLPIYADDANYMSQLGQFIADPTVRDIYEITNKQYSDLGWLEQELGEALGKAADIDDEIDIEHFATYISGLSDYEDRIAVDRESGSVRISLDHYAVGGMEKYSYFGMPMYIVGLCDSAYLASDIMAAIARQYVAMPEENTQTQSSTQAFKHSSNQTITLLDIMISEGKVLYFLDQVMPKKDDALKMRYSEEQMEWMRRNESNVWAYFIQNNLLYEKDFSRYHNFVDEAPKTNAFKDSAPRTPQYIGWQIVRKYMERTKCSMKELFANTDSQAILQASQYKP